VLSIFLVSYFRCLPIISPRKPFFKEAIKDNKKIPAAHFFDLEFGFSFFPIRPVVGDDGVGISADDGFERQFCQYIEMMAQKWFEAIYRFP